MDMFMSLLLALLIRRVQHLTDGVADAALHHANKVERWHLRSLNAHLRSLLLAVVT